MVGNECVCVYVCLGGLAVRVCVCMFGMVGNECVCVYGRVGSESVCVCVCVCVWEGWQLEWRRGPVVWRVSCLCWQNKAGWQVDYDASQSSSQLLSHTHTHTPAFGQNQLFK